MSKEIIIEHKDINNAQNITQVMERKFKENDVDLHRNEVRVLEDDHKKGIRKLEVVNTKFFVVPDLPWKNSHRNKAG